MRKSHFPLVPEHWGNVREELWEPLGCVPLQDLTKQMVRQGCV